MKKICIICKEEKTLDNFYTHPRMADGRLNKCNVCCRAFAKARATQLRENNQEWVEKERKRSREKARRLYSGKKPNKEVKVRAIAKYKIKYPEKTKAKNAVSTVKIESGFHKHHWSYQQDHYKDYIKIGLKDHMLLHRYLIYDAERMMYRRSTDLVLLNTKEEHILYMQYILNNFRHE